jgi:hypothetical protein
VLAAFRRSFDVVPISGEGAPRALKSEEKDAVLNVLLNKILPKDGAGRVILQRSKVRKADVE